MNEKGVVIQMNGLHICATGQCLPEQAVTNAMLSETVDTNDEWISTRTGIKQRYFCKEETNVSLASNAAKQAMERAGISAEDIGVCVVATFTPDYATPSVACLVQQKLGLPAHIPAFDINAACSGFLYGLQIIQGLLATSSARYALLIGSEVISRVLNFEDRTTCVLFGDGAGAVVVERSDAHRFFSVLGASGNAEVLSCNGVGKPHQFLQMNGKEVFRFAVDTIPRCVNEILEKAELTLDDIDYVVCHQANERIISHTVKKLNARPEQFFMNLQRYGNTSAASIPLALDEMAAGRLLKPGMKIICVGFGAGLTWGGALLEW